MAKHLAKHLFLSALVYMDSIIAGVLEAGFASDVIWIHSIFIVVVQFGLRIPKWVNFMFYSSQIYGE